MEKSWPALGVERISEATGGSRLAFFIEREEQWSSQGNCGTDGGPKLHTGLPRVKKISSSWWQDAEHMTFVGPALATGGHSGRQWPRLLKTCQQNSLKVGLVLWVFQHANRPPAASHMLDSCDILTVFFVRSDLEVTGLSSGTFPWECSCSTREEACAGYAHRLTRLPWITPALSLISCGQIT